MRAAKRTALRLLPVAIAVIAGTGINPAKPAWATDPGGAAPSRSVQISAVDLSTPKRVAALYRRIRNAAQSVCGYADNRFSEEQAAWDECVEVAIGHAVARVGSASLTDYYLARVRRGHALPATEVSQVVNRVR